jgi:hypothetical protein
MDWERKWVFLHLWGDPKQIYINFPGGIFFIFGPSFSPLCSTGRERTNLGMDRVVGIRHDLL